MGGVGVFAGQPWHCAVTRFANEPTYPFSYQNETCNDYCEGCPQHQTVQCNHCKHTPELVNASILAAAARRYAAAGRIDDISYLRRMKSYMYCGTKDIGHLGATEKTRDFFLQFAPTENVLYNFSIGSGHCWPEDYGIKKCGNEWDRGLWAVENCAYDGPGALLQHVYGKLRPRAEKLVPSS